MIIGQTLTGSDIKTATANSSNDMFELATSYKVNLYSYCKPYNRNFQQGQLPDYQHGLYRVPEDGIMRYNKPSSNTGIKFGDFRGYNSDSQPSTYFEIDSIIEGGTNIYDQQFGTTLYESITYTVNGSIKRGMYSIDPETISPYTRWQKATGTTMGYGGIIFNKPANTLLENGDNVYDVKTEAQNVSFDFLPLRYGSVRPFNIWYVNRDSSGYHSTNYPLENDFLYENGYQNYKHWYDGITVSPFLMQIGDRSSGRDYGEIYDTPWIQATFYNNFTDRDFNIYLWANIKKDTTWLNATNIELQTVGGVEVTDGKTVNSIVLPASSSITVKFRFITYYLHEDTEYPDFNLQMYNADTDALYVAYSYESNGTDYSYPV